MQPRSGTLLALRVGAGGNVPLVEGAGSSLFFDEISITTGAVLQSIPVPNTGFATGSNLACTLST
jgi:hypothetical protein